MNFGSDRRKRWKDIWGSGQGIGAVKDVVPAAALVARLKSEYQHARLRLGSRSPLVNPAWDMVPEPA
jgi:nitronate monooxygenase